MLKNIEKQTLTVHNKMELGEDISVEAKGKGRKFVSRFIEPGVAHYEEFGDVLITKETLDGFINTMVGCPVIIQHKDIDDENVDKERVGVISNVWFNEFDGWYYCDGIIWDKQAIDLIKNQEWSVSCTYDFDSDKLEKTHNGKKIDMEFTGGEFLHLALVPNPRYERANIVMNAKEKDDDVEWITVHGNHIPVKKGQSKDEAVKEFLDNKNRAQKAFDLAQKVHRGEKLTDEEQEFLKEPPPGDNKDKTYKREADIALTMMAHDYEKRGNKGTVDRTNELKEKLKKGEELTEKDKADIKTALDIYKPKETSDKENSNAIEFKKEYSTIEGMIKRRKLEPRKEEALLEKLEDYKREFDKNLEPHEEEALIQDLNDFKMDIYKNVNARNSKGDLIMSVLNELESFIKGVIKNADDEDKKEDVKNEDKRKLIDEVGGILKGKVDDEIIKTIMKKMEEASYEPSEDKKADNEADEEEKEEKFEEEKKIANKCKNEEEEKEDKEDKVEDEDDEKDEDDEVDKEEVKNKCKNSMKDVKEIIMGGKSKIESDYISKADRFALGEKY